MNIQHFLMFSFALLTSCTLVFADMILLQDGTTKKGKIISEGKDEVILEIAAGMREEIAREEIKEIKRSELRETSSTTPAGSASNSSVPPRLNKPEGADLALIAAIDKGDLGKSKKALEDGASPNVWKNPMVNALILASMKGNV